MEEVVLDGVTYVKAAVIAKRFRYTADYVGQLCRGKKVDARVVGRTWYVNPASLESYKSEARNTQKTTKPASTSVAERDSFVKRVQAATPKRVEPVLHAKTARVLGVQQQKPASLSREVPIMYSVDDGHLMPAITRKHTVVAQVPLQVADSESVRVTAQGTATTFTPETLPEVSLSGNIKVRDLPEEDPQVVSETSDITKENKAISDNSVEVKKRTVQVQRRLHPVAASDRQAKKQHFQAPKPTPLASSQRPQQSVRQGKKVITVPHQNTAVKVVARKSPLKKQTVTPSAELRIAPVAAAVPSPLTSVSKTKSEYSVLSFLLLLLFVLGSGLLVGYMLVVTSSDYTVTASVASSR